MGKLKITEVQYQYIMENIVHHGEEDIPKYTSEIKKLIHEVTEYIKKYSSVILNISLEDILENHEKHVNMLATFEKVCDSFRKKSDIYYHIEDVLDESGIDYSKRREFSSLVSHMDTLADDIDTVKTIYEDLMDLVSNKENFLDYIKKNFPSDITNI